MMTTKGYAAPETKAALQRARMLIEQAEALGEPPEDPLLLFSVLYGVWGGGPYRLQRRRDARRFRRSSWHLRQSKVRPFR